MLLAPLCAIAISLSPAIEKKPYSLDALFLECCSCQGVCSAEITGVDVGCQGMAAMEFRHGSYGGHDFSGTKAAWAFHSSHWVRLYVDAPAEKREALTEFMKAALSDWGALEGVASAEIRIGFAPEHFAASVDNGKLLSFTIKPILGVDGKNGVEIGNLPSPFHRAVMQGQVLDGTFKDGGHDFALRGTNAYYHKNCKVKGTV